MRDTGMNDPNNCAAVRDHFALLLYGELSFEEEERVESHLDGCTECRQALERQKALHDAIDQVAVTPSPALVALCREDFSALLGRERALAKTPWWQVLVSGWNLQVWRPAGAVALLAIGFFAAKITPGWNSGAAFQGMDLANFGGAQVRNVAAQPDGSVRIVFDETRQRMVKGSIADRNIRVLLMSAAKEASDPGLRAQTVTMLTGNAGAEDVRQALIFALGNDESVDVRLKAMEALKQYASDPVVEGALARVVLSDSNSGIRTHAIDALTARPVERLDRQTVGVLQEIMDREDDAYVRGQCERMLRAIKASAEIY